MLMEIILKTELFEHDEITIKIFGDPGAASRGTMRYFIIMLFPEFSSNTYPK